MSHLYWLLYICICTLFEKACAVAFVQLVPVYGAKARTIHDWVILLQLILEMFVMFCHFMPIPLSTGVPPTRRQALVASFLFGDIWRELFPGVGLDERFRHRPRHSICFLSMGSL